MRHVHPPPLWFWISPMVTKYIYIRFIILTCFILGGCNYLSKSCTTWVIHKVEADGRTTPIKLWVWRWRHLALTRQNQYTLADTEDKWDIHPPAPLYTLVKTRHRYCCSTQLPPAIWSDLKSALTHSCYLQIKAQTCEEWTQPSKMFPPTDTTELMHGWIGLSIHDHQNS